ncbi:hypothetical protein [Streptomyces lancefieldiae]|uniref:Uncharacterized protein n=1 Tax=Streptomyces lancefieldiae TaxID=3075520 RepID=A0ABU3B560_9ACTN|nr:hypothetical protein [Streptomyces sp. DSM 40712]MDT0616141.1 hypothetical protein [Streptomyces sp. DSM 40712]
MTLQPHQRSDRKPNSRALPRLLLRRAVLSLAGTTGPALLAFLNWWIHSH